MMRTPHRINNQGQARPVPPLLSSLIQSQHNECCFKLHGMLEYCKCRANIKSW